VFDYVSGNRFEMTDAPEENGEQPKRRRFLKACMAVIGGFISMAIGVPLIGFAISPALKKASQKWVDVGIADLLKGSRYKKVNYTFQAKEGWIQIHQKRSIYVTDEGNGNFVVFSRVCTHLGCLVRWDEKKQQFLCPCHGGVFDPAGNVVAGPPPRPLEKLPVKVEDGVLYVKEA